MSAGAVAGFAYLILVGRRWPTSCGSSGCPGCPRVRSHGRAAQPGQRRRPRSSSPGSGSRCSKSSAGPSSSPASRPGSGAASHGRGRGQPVADSRPRGLLRTLQRRQVRHVRHACRSPSAAPRAATAPHADRRDVQPSGDDSRRRAHLGEALADRRVGLGLLDGVPVGGELEGAALHPTHVGPHPRVDAVGRLTRPVHPRAQVSPRRLRRNRPPRARPARRPRTPEVIGRLGQGATRPARGGPARRCAPARAARARPPPPAPYDAPTTWHRATSLGVEHGEQVVDRAQDVRPRAGAVESPYPSAGRYAGRRAPR